jgi:hypothetical protein
MARSTNPPRRGAQGLLQKLAVLVFIASSACIGSSASAASKDVAAATPAEKSEASNLYAGAMADFERGDLDKALRGFRESYAIVKSPNSHFMVARTLARLGRNAEAYEDLEATVAEANGTGDRYAETVRAAYAKLDEIRPRVALVIVKIAGAPKGTTATINDEHLDESKLGHPVPVLPGDTVVTAITPDDRRYPRAQTVQSGTTTTVTIDVAAEAAKRYSLAEHSFKPTYKVEIEGAIVGETFNPPGDATRGAGPGVRAAFEIVPLGVLGTTDNFALGVGADWIATSTDAHLWVPITLQWNLWLTPALSLRIEPGVALMFGAGTHVGPALYAGLRYRVWRKLYATGRVGIPDATLGLAWFL